MSQSWYKISAKSGSELSNKIFILNQKIAEQIDFDIDDKLKVFQQHERLTNMVLSYYYPPFTASRFQEQLDEIGAEPSSKPPKESVSMAIGNEAAFDTFF